MSAFAIEINALVGFFQSTYFNSFECSVIVYTWILQSMYANYLKKFKVKYHVQISSLLSTYFRIIIE
jgi:hypothetical protein